MAISDPEMAYRHPDPVMEESTNVIFDGKRCCFCLPCFGTRRSSTVRLAWWERIRTTENENHWWSRSFIAIRKLREWSEIVAGPKWKTFIRRFNRNKSGGSSSKQGKFQYDPLSYAMNFDEGPGHSSSFDDDDDDYGGFRDFSARYAPVSAKSADAELVKAKDVPEFL